MRMFGLIKARIVAKNAVAEMIAVAAEASFVGSSFLEFSFFMVV